MAISAYSHYAYKSTDVAGGTSQTFSGIDVGSGDNRFLIIFIKSSAAPSSVTFNGDALTNLATDAGHPGYYETYKDRIYYIANPDAGSHNLVINWPSSHALQTLVIGSYTGVDQASPLDAYEAWTFTATGTTTDEVTVATADAWAIMFSQCYDGSTGFTAGSGTTRRAQVLEASFGSAAIFDSNGGLTVGAHSLTATFPGDDHSDQRIIALKPAGAVVAPTVTTQNNLAMLGVS